ncbi:hypothetical protein DSO57_1025515 [Entomophthora muscae]|uniref:Uncharacterized protein n=1 Tax=Entomophthora muscae TaxID=34485 RepID=A0ACC2U0W2_9FUNG|nr:hypothetical protein DSO57_1025515 [Entomophthora muscae]
MTGLFPKTSKAALAEFCGRFSATVEYIDYRGKDTKCHIRFNTPSEANSFVESFDSKIFYHIGPSDFTTDKTLSDSSGAPRMRVSILSGPEEKSYINKHLSTLTKKA